MADFYIDKYTPWGYICFNKRQQGMQEDVMKQYIVTGMSCAACQARVEKAVSKVSGVDSCSVSLLTNSMGVEGKASPKDIIKAVEDAGYGASVKGEKDVEIARVEFINNYLYEGYCKKGEEYSYIRQYSSITNAQNANYSPKEIQRISFKNGTFENSLSNDRKTISIDMCNYGGIVNIICNIS